MSRALSFTIDGRTYLTTIEAGRRAELTKQYVARLVKKGTLSARRHGGRWIIDETSLAAFVSNRQRRPKRGRPSKGCPERAGP